LRRGLVGLIVGAVLAVAAAPAVAAPTPLTEFGTNGAGAGQIVKPFGLAFDSAGNLYVSERDNQRISVFSPAGTFIRAFGYDVALPANPGAEVFEVCTTATGCKAGFSAAGPGGVDAGQLASPYGIAIDAADRLYVANTNNGRVDVFSVAGGSPTVLHAFGRDVNEPDGGTTFEVCTTMCRKGDTFMGGFAGEFYFARDVEVDATGRLYVADQSGNRISVFDSPGTTSVTFAYAFGAGVEPGGGGGFEVCTTMSGCLAGTADDEAGSLDSPEGVDVDGAGRVYVSDTGNERISVFGTGGQSFIHTFGWDTQAFAGTGEFEVCTGPGIGGCKTGLAGGGDGQLNMPRGVAIDPAGNLQVADTSNKRVTVFSSPGVTASTSLLHAYGFDVATPDGGTAFEVCMLDPGPGQGCIIGNGGSVGFGQLDEGSSVEVDCRGGVWVGDTNHGEIKRYGEPGTPLPVSCPVPSRPGTGSATPASAPAPAPAAAPAKKCKKRKKKRKPQSVAAAKKKKKKCPRKKRKKR
jgi:tripartite motif-containing protein 71